jgi:acyl-CoA synthetase (AMP-forming)/AMP-acid ligase II
MHLGLVLDMVHSGYGDRTAVSAEGTSIDYAGLAERSWSASARFSALGVSSVIYIGGNHVAYPVALFGAAGAGVPFIPLNYRLGPDQLASQINAHPGAFIVYGDGPPAGADPGHAAQADQFLESLAGEPAEPPLPPDPELPCVLLYTSGTTAAPKAAILRHRHLMSYLLGTVEFASAGEDERSLVSVPPYHIARFNPENWLETVRGQGITQAMVIPTMLARVVTHLGEAEDSGTPTLRSLSYGGARMPTPVLHRAMRLFSTTDFVNAYGLTETSSTIALLGPEDHREAFVAADPQALARLGSVGRLLPGIELEVRDDEGGRVAEGELGLLFFRGEQISGEYAGGSVLDHDGWFSSRDRGRIDEDGYLFIEGRADDTIIRGGENIAPAEIEDVLIACDGIVDAAVVGLPDDEWGQRLVAVVVGAPGTSVTADQLKEAVRDQLRSSKTPEVIEFWSELPRTDTGKLLRRQVVAQLSAD